MSIGAGRCRLSIVNSLLLVAAGAMAWQADACGNDAVPVRKVAIGFAGPLTERTAQSAREGAELAVAEANQRQWKLTHGPERLQFELLTQDDKGDPNSAGFAAQYFIRSEVIGVIGHWATGAAMAVAPLYEKKLIPQLMFTASGGQYTQQGYQTAFRTLGSAEKTAFYLASAAVDTLRARRIAVIDNDTPFSQSLSASFVLQLQGKLLKPVYRATVSSKTSDFNTIIKEAALQQAELVFFSANGEQLKAFVQTAKRLRIPAKLLLTGGGINQQYEGAASGDAIYTLEPDAALEQCPHWKVFQKKYAGMFGKPPISFSRYAYNATTILIDAIRQADSLDTAKITAALHRGKYRGLSGEIAFDKDGNALHFFYTLYQYGIPAWQAVKGFASHREASC